MEKVSPNKKETRIDLMNHLTKPKSLQGNSASSKRLIAYILIEQVISSNSELFKQHFV